MPVPDFRRGSMPASEMGERIARGEPCPSCGAAWDDHDDPEGYQPIITMTHKRHCAYDLFCRTERMWPEENDDPAYTRWCFEVSAEAGAYLPMPVWRLDTRLRCEMCGLPGDADHPIWYFRGDPPDPENGPHPNDLPYALHEDGCPPPGPIVRIVYCPTCHSLNACEHDATGVLP